MAIDCVDDHKAKEGLARDQSADLMWLGNTNKEMMTFYHMS